MHFVPLSFALGLGSADHTQTPQSESAGRAIIDRAVWCRKEGALTGSTGVSGVGTHPEPQCALSATNALLCTADSDKSCHIQALHRV